MSWISFYKDFPALSLRLRMVKCDKNQADFFTDFLPMVFKGYAFVNVGQTFYKNKISLGIIIILLFP